MIHDWEDLAYEHNPSHPEYDELKAWLRSQTQDSRMTVTPTSHCVELLRAALQAATYEIRDNLDEQIDLLVKEAKTEYNIRVSKADYYITRTVSWDDFIPTDIDEMSAQDCAELLWAAKEEIAWLCNEISRLQCYISVERKMQDARVKGRNTPLQPLERKKEEQQSEETQGREVEMADVGGVDSGFDASPMSPHAGERMRGSIEGS